MPKEEIFKKYNINESHSTWQPIDDWMSIELYRVMHDGNLPDRNSSDISIQYVADFLDKIKDVKAAASIIRRDDFGSLFLTAKRMIYRHWEHLD